MSPHSEKIELSVALSFTEGFPLHEVLRDIVPDLQAQLTAELKAKHTAWLEERQRLAAMEGQERLAKLEAERQEAERENVRQRFANLMKRRDELQ
ncbi:hypothetical protein P4E94_15715 [Pontiellaceae bacterium B12219]|nr:hypothetical protein [Pontiellaceae bacterium B12219]